MKKLTFLILLIGAIFSARIVAAQMNEKQALSSFFKAEGLYKEQQYVQAIELYEEMISQGFMSGAVYFNLGNAYYKNQNLGRAILNYERAKRLIPRDSDLRFNYQYAFSSVKNIASQQSGTQKFLELFVMRYTVDEFAIFSLIIFIGLVGAILLSIYFSLPKKRVYLICGLFLIVFIMNGLLFFQKLQSETSQAVILKSVEAKFEPLDEATMHFNVSLGMKVRILEGKGLWFKVERDDGKVGWVVSTALEEI